MSLGRHYTGQDFEYEIPSLLRVPKVLEKQNFGRR